MTDLLNRLMSEITKVKEIEFEIIGTEDKIIIEVKDYIIKPLDNKNSLFNIEIGITNKSKNPYFIKNIKLNYKDRDFDFHTRDIIRRFGTLMNESVKQLPIVKDLYILPNQYILRKLEFEADFKPELILKIAGYETKII